MVLYRDAQETEFKILSISAQNIQQIQVQNVPIFVC